MTAWILAYVIFGMILFMGLGGFRNDKPFVFNIARLLISIFAGPIVFVAGFIVAWRKMRRGDK